VRVRFGKRKKEREATEERYRIRSKLKVTEQGDRKEERTKE